MKLYEKLAIESSGDPIDEAGGYYREGFQAGFRKAREMILNNREWSCMNWIECRKGELAIFGEEEVE